MITHYKNLKYLFKIMIRFKYVFIPSWTCGETKYTTKHYIKILIHNIINSHKPDNHKCAYTYYILIIIILRRKELKMYLNFINHIINYHGVLLVNTQLVETVLIRSRGCDLFVPFGIFILSTK